jgi:hypothetical protein
MSGTRPRSSCRRHDDWNIAGGRAVLTLGPISLSGLNCSFSVKLCDFGRLGTIEVKRRELIQKGKENRTKTRAHHRRIGKSGPIISPHSQLSSAGQRPADLQPRGRQGSHMQGIRFWCNGDEMV